MIITPNRHSAEASMVFVSCSYLIYAFSALDYILYFYNPMPIIAKLSFLRVLPFSCIRHFGMILIRIFHTKNPNKHSNMMKFALVIFQIIKRVLYLCECTVTQNNRNKLQHLFSRILCFTKKC